VISFSLYRAKVHIITTKNIFLLGVNSYFVYASSRWLMPILYKFYFNAYLWLIFDPYVIMAISSIICYFLIKVLSDKFDKDQQQFELTTENNPRIHFIIFLVFLIFTLFILTSFFINLILYYKELMPINLYDNLLSLFDHTMLNTINALIVAFVMVRRST
jgi:H+/Cl- antiporter ClcA